MNRFLNCVLLIAAAPLLSGSPGAMAAKPVGGGGSGDSTAPAAIADLTVHQTIYALALRFTATGDDGGVGTASAYDVRAHAREPGESECATGDPASWPPANISGTTVPYTAGTASVLGVRPLEPGTDYCVAIRVADEAANYSPWAIKPGTTVDAGTWTRTDFPSSTTNPLYGIDSGASITAGVDGPVMGWLVLSEGGSTLPIVELAGVNINGTWQQQVDLTGAFLGVTSRSLKIAAVPDSPNAPIGAVMAGNTQSAGDPAYLLIEGAGPDGNPVSVTTIATAGGPKLTVGDIDREADSAIAFVPRTDGSGWNPVVTLDRVDAISNQSKTSSLRVAERDASGQWTETPVLYRTGTGITVSAGYFNRVQLLTKPGGELGLLADHCKIMVYAERSLDGVWAYFDAGPLLDYSKLPLLALDGSGEVLLASRGDVNGIVNEAILIGRKIRFKPLGRKPPPATCIAVGTSAVEADFWEPVVVPLDPIAGGWYPRGITEVEGATFIAAQKRGEMRIVYRCDPQTPWAMENLTRIDQGGSMFAGPVLDAGGNTLALYSSGRNGTIDGPRIDKANLAKAMGNACGVPQS